MSERDYSIKISLCFAQTSEFVPLVHSKTALLEGLEVDQYMLGILVYIQK